MAVVDELIAVLGYELRGEQNLARFQNGLSRVQRGIGSMAVMAARGATILGGAAIAATGVAVRNAISWEQALTDLNAPLNASAETLAAVGEELTALSENMPVAREGLAELAGGFARTGIAAEDLAGYAELAAKASVAWEMGAAQTGDVMAELANVYQLNRDGLEGLADTINHLANNYATTGDKLTLFLSRASAAAGMLGMTDDEIAGIGAGLTAMGIRASTAGDAMTKMAAQIMGDGPGVSEALESLGTNVKDVQQAFLSDGPEAFLAIFERIAELPVAEQTEALKALFGQEYMDDFGKVVNNLDLMREAIKDATDEEAKLGSVTQEYDNQVGTIRAKWQTLKNNIVSAGDAVGGPMLTNLHKVLDASNAFVKAWNDTGDIKAAFEAMNLPPGVTERLNNMADAVGRVVDAAKAIAATDTFQAIVDLQRQLVGYAVEGVSTIAEGLASSFEMLDAFFDKLGALKDRAAEIVGITREAESDGKSAIERKYGLPETSTGYNPYEPAPDETSTRRGTRPTDLALVEFKAAMASLSALSTNLAGNMAGTDQAAVTEEIVNDSRDQSSHVQVSVTQNVALTEASASAAGAVAQATGSAAASAATPSRSYAGGGGGR